MHAFEIVRQNKNKSVLIHEQAMRVSRDFKNHYLELFEILLEVEANQIYLEFEIPSIYCYCVELLELSPSVAKDFITVVRKSLELPMLATQIRSKRIAIFKARKICSVINETNYKEWIELAASCSTRIVEKAVAHANPREAVAESLKYASDHRLELKLGVSEEWAELLNKTKDLFSQKLRRNVGSEEALLLLMKDHLRKNDPLCTYVDLKGQRCSSTRWLHMHHLLHFAKGGQHSIENLQTLCSAHHKMLHINEIR